MKVLKIVLLVALFATTNLFSQSSNREILNSINRYFNLEKNLTNIEAIKITKQLNKGFSTPVILLDNKKLKLYFDKELAKFYKEVATDEVLLFKGIQGNSNSFIYKFEKDKTLYYSDINTLDYIDTHSNSNELFYIHTALRDVIATHMEKEFFRSSTNLYRLKPLKSNFDSPELIFDLSYFIKRDKKIKSPLSLAIKLVTKINGLAEYKGTATIEIKVNDFNSSSLLKYVGGDIGKDKATEIFFFEKENFGELFRLPELTIIKKISVYISSGQSFAEFDLPTNYINEIQKIKDSHRNLTF